jgi:hypothetical protein
LFTKLKPPGGYFAVRLTAKPNTSPFMRESVGRPANRRLVATLGIQKIHRRGSKHRSAGVNPDRVTVKKS